ncbi:MAG: HIT domain-containing protein [Anaerolineales bacterium]|nr:MAG: HIT domain-containing protein [Anaerolineales bacterium]
MCIFCDIIAGKIPASVVYEDTHTLAFMDLRQANPGHVLIVPKIHVEKITDCPLDIAAALLPVVVKVAQAVQQAFNPDGLSITQANGAAAMQEVPHIHIHVIPRYFHDGVIRFYTKGAPDITPRTSLNAWGERIRLAMPEDSG